MGGAAKGDGAVRAVLRRRLATQRLTSAPLPRAADVVELLCAVQCQERDQGLYSLALRTRDAAVDDVRSELDAGAILRTHVLRPTWHFVRPQDLRWLLALTSPRVEPSMAARHRQLGLDDATLLSRSLDAVQEMLQGRNFLTRREIGDRLAGRRGVARAGQQLGHLLMMGELRGLICSGPTKGVHHSYAVLDEVVPPTPVRGREEAVVELAHRFFGGHGPASVKDFTRWSSLTVADTDAALGELGAVLACAEVDGTPLWYDPSVSARTTAPRRAYLLPVYDEVALTYPTVGFPVLAGHPHEDARNPWQNDAFVGGIIADEQNLGTWKRTVTQGAVTVRATLAPSADPQQRHLVRDAAQRLADLHGRELTYSTS